MRRDDRPELPTLESGVQLLDVQATGRGDRLEPLAALVVDHLLRTGGRARWVDAGGHARTGPLVRLAPETRLLDRVHVARGFTAHQHAELVRRLRSRVDDGTALLVVPAVDARYREEAGADGQALLLRSLARLTRLARDHAVPVVVTRRRADDFAAPVERASERVIECERTRFGLRFRTEAFETLVYPQGDGTVQTTLAFWQSVLAARHEGVTVDPAGAVADDAATRADATNREADGHPFASTGAVPGEVVTDGAY
ncbi:hypothetical protein [Halorientalis marina]|uniref:hypothetical protein n=1 Tax=Halorientalis marina TaxID=2931976 RepID=UPI001FF1C4C3|nr:hypothetical protein [Halorientalis marina]